MSEKNNIKFKPLNTLNERGKEQIVLKRFGNKLEFNKTESAKEAVRQFKKLIKEIQNDYKDRGETIRNMSMVDTTSDYTPKKGLTPEENRERKGVLNPPENIDKSTRQEFLKIQLDHIKNTLDKTIEERDNTNNPKKYIDLEERIIGLREYIGEINNQIEKEEVREQQEEDISRLQRFKEWAKENMVGLSAIATSIAGIITTIIVSTRKAILRGAQATGKFAKALNNLSKKF